MLFNNKYSFKLISKKRFFEKEESHLDLDKKKSLSKSESEEIKNSDRRAFIKALGFTGLGLIATSAFPKKADALVMGSTPSSSVVGLRNSNNTRINPATEETLSNLISGQGVVKTTTTLNASGNVLIPTSGKRIRVYASRFSLSADLNSVSFRFTSGGSDYEKYISPKTGGLYGSNNHPNFVEGGIDEVLYCVIDGTATLQINIDYLEV